jgi:N-acetylmuramic acid 6-phosphate etherase
MNRNGAASSLDELLTEQVNAASLGIDSKPTLEILSIINDEDARVAGSVRAVLPDIARAVDRIVASFQGGGRLFYIGAGTSGRLGVLDAAECPPTFNVSAELVQGIIAGGERALAQATEASEDDPALGEHDLLSRGFGPKDVLCGIAASGRTPYVLGAIRAARRREAATIGVSCTPQSELSREAEIAITPLPGPEIIAGSTRMKAGTATKMVLNMLTTASMIRMGYVYGNLMVNVQPKNEKLLARARRIVSQAAEVSPEQAAKLLDMAGGVVKTAIVMGRRHIGRTAAEMLLERAGGSVSRALTLD